MNSDKNLFLFTSSFPYGKGETFLENELPYLVENFKDVMIIPKNNWDTEQFRKTNAKIISPLLNNGKYKSLF
jgi:hypothetical protein